MSTIKQMIDSIDAGQQIDVAAILRDALTDKSLERLADLKVNVAIDHFNTEAVTDPYSTTDASKAHSKAMQTHTTAGKQLSPSFKPSKFTAKSAASNEA